ncbi:hypothetical protein [Streptomyces sp. LN590]|uniref:hypothetical protein n=1 Tax=Streptomyces sp. LN590 TaxID=3112980 RepID=UPI0037109B9A
MPRPVIMPLVLSEMAGLIWVRPVGEDTLTGIAESANIAAAADGRPRPRASSARRHDTPM